MKIVERAVPTAMDRLNALGEVATWGTAGVNLRLRPFMIGVSNPTHLDLIREAAKRGAQAVTTEFFCLESRANNIVKQRYVVMSKACGFDLYQFYKRNSRGSGYLRLNYEVKRPYVEEMQALCKELKIGFFVSDAHHKEKCVLANGCRWGSCCGLPQDAYFSGYAKCQYTEAITIAKEKGEVRFSDISKEFHDFLNNTLARTVLHSGDGSSYYHKTLLDYMRWCWNNPTKAANGPYRYFDKLMIPTGLDEEKNVIYRFNSEKYGNKAK